MAESLHEQISAALKTRLATIVGNSGTTYWYTPDKVVRCLYFGEDWLDSSYDLLYFLKPETDTVAEGTTGTVKGSAPFALLIAKKYERATINPFEDEAETIGATLIGRCVADARKVLLSEPTLGGLAWNVAKGELTADFSYQVGGAWLCAMLNFTVDYDYPR